VDENMLRQYEDELKSVAAQPLPEEDDDI